MPPFPLSLQSLDREAPPHVVRFLEFQREDFLSIDALFPFIEGICLIETVIVELPGVRRTADFRLYAKHVPHASMDSFKRPDYFFRLFRAKAERIDESRRNTPPILPAVFLRVEHIAEHEAVQKPQKFRRDVVVIDGGTEYERVGFSHHFQNGGKFVLHGAVAVPAAFEFAGKTAHTALELERVELDELRFRPGGSRTFESGLKHGKGIALETRTAVERKYHIPSLRCIARIFPKDYASSRHCASILAEIPALG